MHRGVEKVSFFPESAQHQALGSLQRARSGRPSSSRESSVLALSLQPGRVERAKGWQRQLPTVRVRGKVPGQCGTPLSDGPFTQPLACHCLPGAGQLPPQSGGPQNQSTSDQEEMAGLARRPGHSVSLDCFRCGWSPQGHKFSRENVTHFHTLSHVEN